MATACEAEWDEQRVRRGRGGRMAQWTWLLWADGVVDTAAMGGRCRESGRDDQGQGMFWTARKQMSWGAESVREAIVPLMLRPITAHIQNGASGQTHTPGRTTSHQE
jgi:hypothetical protein